MENKAPKSLAVGGENSGKTALQLHLARKEKWLVIMDLNDEAKFNDDAVVVRDKGQFVKAIKRLYQAKCDGIPFRVTWHVEGNTCPREALDIAIKGIQLAGGCALFLDESESFIPVLNKPSPLVFDLAKRGRHKNPIPLYLTAQKPTELHNKIRTNLSKIMFFYAEDAGTIGFMMAKKRLFHNKAEIHKLLLSLGKFEFLLDEKGKPLKKMKKVKLS